VQKRTSAPQCARPETRRQREHRAGRPDEDQAIPQAKAPSPRLAGVKIQLISSTIGSFNRKNLAELARQYRLPSMFVNRQYTDAGGLMFYGPNYSAIWRLLAEYVDKILKGAAPADLPIQ
jgi:hypothetical protein